MDVWTFGEQQILCVTVWYHNTTQYYNYNNLDVWTFGRLDGWTFGEQQILCVTVWHHNTTQCYNYNNLDVWTFGRLDVWTFGEQQILCVTVWLHNTTQYYNCTPKQTLTDTFTPVPPSGRCCPQLGVANSSESTPHTPETPL